MVLPVQRVFNFLTSPIFAQYKSAYRYLLGLGHTIAAVNSQQLARNILRIITPEEYESRGHFGRFGIAIEQDAPQIYFLQFFIRGNFLGHICCHNAQGDHIGRHIELCKLPVC